MRPQPTEELTERQQRELEYHRRYAGKHNPLEMPVNMEIITSPKRRWWNAYWCVFDRLIALNLRGKHALVVGCGFGDDAILLAALGAESFGFDLSVESLEVARQRAAMVNQKVQFEQMPAEHLTYPDRMFDVILAVDILHHVDIPATMRELQRVAKPGCVFIANEIYTHSSLQRVRNAELVTQVIYPRLVRWIYGTNDPYITEDERKLDEVDIRRCEEALEDFDMTFYNFTVNRVIPDRFTRVVQAERLVFKALGRRGVYFGARVVMSGAIGKRD